MDVRCRLRPALLSVRTRFLVPRGEPVDQVDEFAGSSGGWAALDNSAILVDEHQPESARSQCRAERTQRRGIRIHKNLDVALDEFVLALRKHIQLLVEARIVGGVRKDNDWPCNPEKILERWLRNMARVLCKACRISSDWSYKVSPAGVSRVG